MTNNNEVDLSSSSDVSSPTAEADAFLAQHPHFEAVEYLMTDVNGVLRGKWAPIESLPKAFETGINFPLSLFGLDIWGREVMETGLHVDTGDRDGFCMAVSGTIREVPWADRPTAQVTLTMHTDEAEPFYADPRQCLENMVKRMDAAGLRAVCAFELEFYLLDPKAQPADDGTPSPVLNDAAGPDRQNMYSLSDLSHFEGLFADIRAHGLAQDLPLDTIVSEAAPGQFEVNLKHRADPLAAADDAILLKRLITETARHHGLTATFMAKPFMGWPGNGMHVHASVIDKDGNNIFADEEKGERLLEAAIAGLLDNMADSTLCFVPGWNGFRRLQPGSYAPTSASWGHNNRSVAVRVPASPPEATRIEHRIAGADANPYLVVTAILGAMMEGIENDMVPPPAVELNAYEEAAPQLPSTMPNAIERFGKSAFTAKAFGTEFRDMFVAIKQAEAEAFLVEITPLERSTYL